jgi:hypothetical protein
LTLLTPLVERLGPTATLKRVEAADHSFHVLARSGRKDTEVLAELAESVAAWAKGL